MPPVSPSRALRRPLLLLSGLCAVGVAARFQAAPPAQPPAVPAASAQPPVVLPDSAAAAAADSSMATDSVRADSMSAAAMAVTAAPAPAAAPTTWPVDPVTGQTLINGEPVVGRVFIMEKTDGTVKIADVAAALAGEPPAPEAAIVGGTGPAPLTATRRMRGVMIQATLWDQDHKRSAVRHRLYGPSVSGSQLGQQ